MQREATEVMGSTRYRDTLIWLMLLILSQRPMHGYEIIKKINELTANQWKPAAGSIYPLLSYMKDLGLIDVVVVEEEGVRGGRKIVYALTDRGWQQLNEILARKVQIYANFLDLIADSSLKALEEHGFADSAKALRTKLLEWATQFQKRLAEG